jgi:tight adherence protein C
MVAAILVIAMIMGIFFVMANELGRENRINKRLSYVTGGGEPVVEDLKHEGPLALRIISSFGMLVVRTGMLEGSMAQITATLEGIGLRGGKGLGLFIGAKIMLLPVVALLVFAISLHMGVTGMFLGVYTFAGGVLGMLLPEWIAKNRRAAHIAKVSTGVPDALDMLVICADSGLALEAGISRVAQEIATLNPNLAMELNQTSRELQIGSDMRSAMEALGNRTGLDTLKRLATTLAQSLQFGTPLTAALRSLSNELRAEALVRFEEKAGKLPTLMTMPMILFILPCVFLIVAGPAIINVMSSFAGQK